MPSDEEKAQMALGLMVQCSKCRAVVKVADSWFRLADDTKFCRECAMSAGRKLELYLNYKP